MRRTSGEDAVVVPAGHGGSSLACLRSLGRQGVRTIGVAATADAPAFASKYCDETGLVPPASADLRAYGDALLDLAARPDVVTFAPLYEPDSYVLSKRRAEFAEHVATPWPSFETVQLAQDRLALVERAREVGVATPDTALVDEWDDWDRPTVVKPRYSIVVSDGRASYPDVHVFGPGERPDVDALVAEMGHVPIAQSFVPGEFECGFFGLYDRGEPVATFQHRRVRSYTYSGGASVFRKSMADPALQRAGTDLLAALDWHGPAMVEMKRDPRNGRYTLVEVNPRFWGSLPLAVHAGVDFPHLYYRLATGGVDRPVFEYDVDVGCHVLRGEASYLHSVARYDLDHVERPGLLAATADVLGSLVRHRRFDYLSLDDPGPFLGDLRSVVAPLVRSVAVPAVDPEPPVENRQA